MMIQSDLDHLQSHINRQRVRKPVYIGEQEKGWEQEKVVVVEVAVVESTGSSLVRLNGPSWTENHKLLSCVCGLCIVPATVLCLCSLKIIFVLEMLFVKHSQHCIYFFLWLHFTLQDLFQAKTAGE